MRQTIFALVLVCVAAIAYGAGTQPATRPATLDERVTALEDRVQRVVDAIKKQQEIRNDLNDLQNRRDEVTIKALDALGQRVSALERK